MDRLYQRLVAVAALLIGVAFLWQTSPLPASARLVPYLASGAAITLILAYLIAQRFVKPEQAEEGEEEDDDATFLPFSTTLVVTVAYLAAIYYLGFYVATAVLLVFAPIIRSTSGSRKWIVSGTFAGISILVLRVVFQGALAVPTPQGLLLPF